MRERPQLLSKAISNFTDPLVVEYLDGEKWAVRETFAYQHALGLFLVPAGFVTDFATVPRFFWRIIPPTGQYGKATVIHDYLYLTPTYHVTRAQADQVFLDAMADLGVPEFQRRMMYGLVRAFGYGYVAR